MFEGLDGFQGLEAWLLTFAPLGRELAGARRTGVSALRRHDRPFGRSASDDGRPWVLGVGARYQIEIEIEITIMIEIKIRIEMLPVYTSVRMLEWARRFATFCHFSEECGNCFGGVAALQVQWASSNRNGVRRFWAISKAVGTCHRNLPLAGTYVVHYVLGRFLEPFFNEIREAPGERARFRWRDLVAWRTVGTGTSLRGAKGDNGGWRNGEVPSRGEGRRCRQPTVSQRGTDAWGLSVPFPRIAAC